MSIHASSQIVKDHVIGSYVDNETLAGVSANSHVSLTARAESDERMPDAVEGPDQVSNG